MKKKRSNLIKKLTALMLILSLSFALSSFTAAASNDIKVLLDGTPINFDVPPQIIDGRTMVPMRAIFEAMGASVEWDEKSRSIGAIKGSTLIIMVVGEKAYLNKNGVSNLDVAPQIINGRTLVPARAVAECFDCKVTWDSTTRTVSITSSSNSNTSYSPSTPAVTGYGSVTGLLTWQYNEYVGTKPDTGAKILLISANRTPHSTDRTAVGLFNANNDASNTMYSTTADGSGNYYLDNIPCGKYYLLVLSKNTNQSFDMRDINKRTAENMLSGVISDEAIESLKIQIGVYSFKIKEITISPNQTYRFSHDWGYTYI